MPRYLQLLTFNGHASAAVVLFRWFRYPWSDPTRGGDLWQQTCLSPVNDDMTPWRACLCCRAACACRIAILCTGAAAPVVCGPQVHQPGGRVRGGCADEAVLGVRGGPLLQPGVPAVGMEAAPAGLQGAEGWAAGGACMTR